MTDPASLWWSRPGLADDEPAVHALVIGVSRYDHLVGGSGPVATSPLLGGIGQLSAAATSATRMAEWLRDHFDYPEVQLGSVMLLASPTEGEVPLPGGATPPPATFAEVRSAVGLWRRRVRSTPGNIALLYVAGHGIQLAQEGGVLLLQDVGHPDSLTPLDGALDVASVRRAMVSDPNDPAVHTPPVQYYFYDACRVFPQASLAFEELKAGIYLDAPRGEEAEASFLVWGSRSGDYALADPETRTTLFSQALIDTLLTGAAPDADGRTVRFYIFSVEIDRAVQAIAEQFGDEQKVMVGGGGRTVTPVFLRPATVSGGGGSPPPPGLVRSELLVSTTDGQPYGFTVRRQGEIVADGLTGTPVTVPAGRSTVVLDLPWGGAAERPVEVQGPVELTVDLPRQPADAVPQASRLNRQLGPSGQDEAWFLRMVTWTPGGLAYRPEVWPPDLEVHRDEGGTVTLLVRARDHAPSYAQLRTADGRSLVVALPIQRDTATDDCWLHVRVSAAGLGAVVRFTDARLDACAGYLTGGRPDHAAALSDTAEELLYTKMASPIAAALGGYALLRLGDLERLHDWADNLADWFDWLPDGAAVAADRAARLGEQEKAVRNLTRCVDRGLPLFTAGLSVLGNRLPAALATLPPAPTIQGWPGVVSPLHVPDYAAGSPAEAILSLCPFADFEALTTTLHIDPDPGPVDTDHGWQRFADGELRHPA